MEFLEKVLESEKVILIITKGKIPHEEFGRLAAKSRMKALKLGYKILHDSRESEHNISIQEAYRWIEEYYDKINPKLKYIPTAHLISKKEEEFSRFLATSWLSKGARVKIFLEEDEAYKWLKSE